MDTDTPGRPAQAGPVGAATLVALVAAFLLARGIAGPGHPGRSQVRAAPRYTRFWPSFVETYTEEELDASSDHRPLVVTHRLTVVDEFNWHDEVIQDSWAGEPLLGNYLDLRGGVLRNHYAQTNQTGVRLVGREELEVVAPELDPSLLFLTEHNASTGWQETEPEPGITVAVSNPLAGRVAITCQQRQCPQEPSIFAYHIEYDAGSVHREATPLNGLPYGGIPVYAETWRNGRLESVFKAISLELRLVVS